MIVSLPMQGIAAAIKLPCAMMMTHAATADSQAADMDDCDDAEMAIDQPQTVEQAGAAMDHADAPCSMDSHQKHSSCRACSACYLGASAPPPLFLAGLPTAHYTNDYLSPASSFTGWIPSRIERPPRFSAYAS